MNSSNTLTTTVILLFQILVCLISHIIAQHARVCQDTYGNYTTNSTFARNLDKLFSAITSNTQIDYGFYNFSFGYGMDRVNGIALCRPDLSVALCQSCLKEASSEISGYCYYQRDAIMWYDQCMLRYSDRYIFSKLEFGPWFHDNSSLFGADVEGLDQKASTLLTRLKKEASFSGDSRYKFAAGVVNVGQPWSVYALVQCTPDLEEYDCYNCLDNAINFSFSYSSGRQGYVFYTSCNIRYESWAFYNVTSLRFLDHEKRRHSSPPPLPPISPLITVTKKGRRTKKSRTIVILLALLTSLTLMSILFVYCRFRREKSKKALKKVEIGDEIKTPESLHMDFATVEAATGHFSDANMLGRGGFGTVYKGRLPNGQAIAVKRSQCAGQGEEAFKNEALLVARLQHRNLVRLLGFCVQNEERLLIYELLPNKSLDYFLFDPVKRLHLDWRTRYKIVQDIARGLLYLHEDSRLLVVHRDLKAGNILLDAEMNAKISDFGTAKPFSANETHGNASKICGTYGYMPPEYVQHGQFSIKSDVFGFGVLLLEIISGLRVSSFHNSEVGDNLLSFAWKNWLEGTALNMVDSTMSSVNTAEVVRCINVGLLCVQENIVHRPIMSSVVLMLNCNTIALPMPSRPAFLLHADVHPDGSTPLSDQVVDHSVNYTSISEFDAR